MTFAPCPVSTRVAKNNGITRVSHGTPKFEYFEKLPVELKVQILEYCLIDPNDIHISGDIEFDRDMHCQEDKHNEWETLKRIRHHISSIARIDRILVHDLASLDDEDYHHFAELQSALFAFDIDGPPNARPPLLAELSDTACLYVHRWAHYKKFWVNERDTSKACDNMRNLVQVSSSVAALACSIFYGKNSFATDFGFVVLEAWLDTIGPINASYVKHLRVKLTFLPPCPWIKDIFFRPNLLGLAVDEIAEKIGFRPLHECSRYPERDHDDRLKESLITFRDMFGKNKPNKGASRLKSIYLCVDEDLVQACLEDVRQDNYQEDHHIFRLLDFSDKSTFPFQVTLDVATSPPADLEHHLEIEDAVAVLHEEFHKLGWKLQFENPLLQCWLGKISSL